jgi:DNA-directed RNA polymerase specialized sigma24 family protein
MTDNGSGVPRSVYPAWLYGGSKEGKNFGPAGDGKMRVRDRFGRGFTTAHPGSLAAEVRPDALAARCEAAGLTARQRDAVLRTAGGATVADLARMAGVSYVTARERLKSALKRLADHAAAIEAMR